MENPSFEACLKKMPKCLFGSLDLLVHTEPEDLGRMAMLEIDLHEEEQDGCLGNQEIKAVRRFVSWLASSGVDILV